jgi:hypothetical protein
MIRFIKFDGRERRVVTIPRWAIGLGLVAAVLVGLLLFVLAAGLALIAVPIAIVAGAVATWIGRGRRVPSPDTRRRASEEHRDIIDAEFRVIEQHERRKP